MAHRTLHGVLRWLACQCAQFAQARAHVDKKLIAMGPMGDERGVARVAPVIQFYAIIGPQQYTHQSIGGVHCNGQLFATQESLDCCLVIIAAGDGAIEVQDVLLKH